MIYNVLDVVVIINYSENEKNELENLISKC